MKKYIVLFFPVLVLALALSLQGKTVPTNNTSSQVAETKGLPVVGSFNKLKALLKENENSMVQRYGLFRAASAEGVAQDLSSAAKDKAQSYSKTNVQVQGVDEADTVKTDGQYIYQVNNQKVIIAKAYPEDELKISRTLKFAKGFSPMELYVDEKYLVVIGNFFYQTPLDGKSKGTSSSKKIRPGFDFTNTVRSYIYDISDKEAIKEIRQVELEGDYISSRKIGTSLYLIANKFIDTYRILEQKEEVPTPGYRDNLKQKDFIKCKYSDIRYFPGAVEPNYLMVAAVDLSSDKGAEITSYLGSGNNVYVSTENLYVAVTQYEMPKNQGEKGKIGNNPNNFAVDIAIMPSASKTLIYKFGLSQGKVNYSGKGEVAGSILNQYSMDEYNGYFRIATTKGEVWNEKEKSENNLYILDEKLKVIGKLEKMAQGEKIYSVRFMGDRGYMVTFKKVDPLFVIDLKNPKEPKILGYLKIPGYSDYIHPYDENHIIGFGKDAVELPQKDPTGKVIGTLVYYQGMKLALFDVTDVTKPVEKFKEIIGDRGTESEILHNPKALLFDKDKNLMAFPVTVMEVGKGSNLQGPDMPAYGGFAFQGAYVYNVDLVKGFTLKKKISHLSSQELKTKSMEWPNGEKFIERILYIGDNLYTLSKEMIKTHDLNTFVEKKNLLIPKQ